MESIPLQFEFRGARYAAIVKVFKNRGTRRFRILVLDGQLDRTPPGSEIIILRPENDYSVADDLRN